MIDTLTNHFLTRKIFLDRTFTTIKYLPLKPTKGEKNTSKNLDFLFLHLITWHYRCKNSEVNEYLQTKEIDEMKLILPTKKLQCFQNDVTDESNLVVTIQMYEQG